VVISGQLDLFIVCIGEFGVSSADDVRPQLLRVVSGVISDLIALEVNQKCLQP
jgi:hypothetical protein